MSESLRDHLEHLKSALLSLRATGESGFEGLIGAVLREISGVPFRLAGSGSQFGVDGKPTDEGDAICFEGKRYDGTIPRSEVLTKIAEFSIRDNETDVWVLGATSQITSQLAGDARKLGAESGITVLILDWSETALPPFAVALAMGGSRAQEFLKRNISDKKTLQGALAALVAVKNSPDFAPDANRISAQCNAPAVAHALAQRANNAWLSDAFSSTKRARVKLGQPLSPGETGTADIRERKTLTDTLRPYLTAAPDETVVCILGDEGHGKSWVVAQSWLALEHRPLMVFMTPDDFVEPYGENVVDLLITQLIRQTGDEVAENSRRRWLRRLRQWRSQPATSGPSLVVVIDGINQRPKSDWARIIENIGDELNRLGGRLILTARTRYFCDHVKRRLYVRVAEISVPEWTEAERDEILNGHGIKASDLQRAVARSLRNPRLLTIALELLSKDDVTRLEELSVSRLLFEHIRMSERDAPVPQPAQEFARRLQKHAQDIIARIKEKQHDDLYIFEDNMEAVADARFYQAVDGDPMRYSLRDDGLTLALGFAVIDRLRTAKRNDRTLDPELAAILEPIAALDDTADVILAALTVTSADERYEQDIAASLVSGFAALQNPDEAKFPAFVGLAKGWPQGFMDAARALSLAGGHQANFDWIEGALIVASRNNYAWSRMTEAIHSWLSVYSLSPERGTFSHPSRDPHEKVLEEIGKNRAKIEKRVKALSATERAILDDMQETEGNLSRLSRLAFLLLAGKPLSSLVRSLMNWSFANALNPDHAAPYKDFMHVVALNRVDWSRTRAALMEASAALREPDVSTTGKWALVYLLRATGHPDDGKAERLLVEDLTKDRPRFEGWRLVESYCAADPCDPASERPENIVQTARQYAAIDVSKLRLHMGHTSEDHFFVMARAGVARFSPDVAVAKHKEFCSDVLRRTGFPLRQGLLELRKHNALLTVEDARELVKKRTLKKSAGEANSLSEQDARIVSQYHLLLAFPFFSAHEQAEILLSDETDESILLDLLDVAKPLSGAEFENLLRAACSDKDEHKQYLLLVFATYTSVQLSTSAREHIAMLLQSASERVRTQALGVIAQGDYEELLARVAESDWKASDTERAEDWYGSTVLLKAAARNLITHEEALNRIAPCLYGRAATMLDTGAVREVARRVDASILQAAGLGGNLVAPDIELEAGSVSPDGPGRFLIRERSTGTKSIEEEMRQFSESNDAFEQRQKRALEAFNEFATNLTRAKAQIILDRLSLKEFESLAASDRALAERWCTLFLKIDKSKLPAVHNLVLLLAYALARTAPDKAKELFQKVKNNKPLVRFTFGKAGIHFDAMATWAATCNPVLNDLGFARLDHAATDHELSIEVLAALLNGQQELLAEYIEEKLRMEEPAEIARGAMVAGFSDRSEFSEEILKKNEGSAGFLGSAQRAAKYAYERNVWARHWFEKMCQTRENTDFWRYSVLFSKIVDGRFAVWRDNYERSGNPIKLFWPSVNSQLKNRFERWENHRKKKLFGSDAPAPIFFAELDINE